MAIGSPLVPLQVKVSTETLKNFEDAYGASECNTKGAFMEMVLEAFLNPPKPKGSKPEDLTTIQNLTNEIGRLKIEIDRLNDENQEMRILHNAAKEAITNYENQTAQLSQRPELTDLDIVVSVTPLQKRCLEVEQINLRKKIKKEFSLGEILLNSYRDLIQTGGRTFPVMQWGSIDIRKVEKSLTLPV